MDDLALRSDSAFNIIGLCVGGGGLERAFGLAIPSARPVVLVEREAFAVAGLVAQIEAGLMAPAAIWSDVRTFNGRPWRGIVQGLVAGIPCQPHSLAGRRGGSTDERDLWAPRGARRIIAQMRPFVVVIENVGGFLTAGADEIAGAERVVRGLRKLGYTVTICIVRASDVGLPHERERVFVIGVADAHGRLPAGRSVGPGEAHSWWPHPEPAGSGSRVQSPGVGLADACSPGLQGRGPRGNRAERITAAERGRGEVVDAAGIRRGEGRSEPELRSWRGSASSPGDELGDAARDDGRLHARSRGEGGGAPDSGGAGQMVDAIGGRHDGRPEGALGRSIGRDAEQLAGAYGCRPSLRPPGPGDVAAWRVIATDRPDLLPALSSYDRFRIAMRDEGLTPAGAGPSADLGSQEGQGWGVGGGAARWVDARTGEPVDSARLQAAAQSALRRVADVMATRIDELRLLGNGVADAQGGLAIRIGLNDLAASGSATAARLVRLMEGAQP